jgi:hypothetical protein
MTRRFCIACTLNQDLDKIITLALHAIVHLAMVAVSISLN